MSRRNPGPAPAPKRDPGPSTSGDDPDAVLAAWLGERLRRVALGATAALLTARAYWPSEPDLRADAGGGLVWVLALLVVAGVALAGALAGGGLRFRWSWADAAVVALAALIAAGAEHAVDRRVAINLAIEWAGFGVAYLLVRNLPQTRGESTALAGATAAMAVALSVYGLYQVGVELPEVQYKYLHNARYRADALRIARVVPGTAAQGLFENRLLGSNEPCATFALANSLAGFLVGPLVLMLAVLWDGLTRRDGRGPRAGAILLALPPLVVVLVCLVLTKSRSAYVGLAAGVLALAWRERRRVRPRTLALGLVAAGLVAAAVAAAGLASGRLDRLVLTETPKSFRYRQEYWVGTWRTINESWPSGAATGRATSRRLTSATSSPRRARRSPTRTTWCWRSGRRAAPGPPSRSPRRSSSGSATPSCPRRRPTPGPGEAQTDPSPAKTSRDDPSAPPASSGWLIASAGGGWLAVVLLGRLDLIGGGDFDRWLILGGSWLVAVASGVALWRRRPLDPAALGAAALAVLVNLIAAGGIGVPAVALALWTTVALGLNLRDDRPCGRPRGPLGRLPAFALAAVWAALLGTFSGLVTPFWKAEALMARADEALAARPPDIARAESAYTRAAEADRLIARPWLALAALDFEVWKERGFKPDDERWKKIPIEMLKAVSRPRSPESWSLHLERARMTRMILTQLGEKIPPMMTTQYRADVVHSSRRAAQLYPTSATLRARLAEASADIHMFADAVKEGREALRLDALTPHADKKLEPSVRQWLESNLPDWEKTAAQTPLSPPPKTKSRSKPRGG